MKAVYVARNGRKVYHELFCPYIRDNKNLMILGEPAAVERGYQPCKFCFSIRGVVFKCRHINQVHSSYDPIDNAVCIRTAVGFWKVIWRENVGKWHLFHLNHNKFDPKASDKILMRRSFHRQYDLYETPSINKVIHYIQEHDKSIIDTDGDYHKLPKTTKKQKHYYKQAKKRAKQKSVRNVYKILDNLNQNGSK